MHPYPSSGAPASPPVTATAGHATAGGAGPAGGPAAGIEAWLDACEADLVHPAEVEDRLRRAGWNPGAAAATAFEYRRRFNEHPLGYSVLLVTTGLAALATGSSAHVIAAGLTGPVNRNALAAWMTVMVCSLPFAAWTRWWAVRIDREDPVAAWSSPRRNLALVLLWASGVVGIGRLVLYVGQLMAVLVGADRGPRISAAAGALNVAIVVAIALPTGLWAHAFRHRFDGEDPTAPAAHRRPDHDARAAGSRRMGDPR